MKSFIATTFLIFTLLPFSMVMADEALKLDIQITRKSNGNHRVEYTQNCAKCEVRTDIELTNKRGDVHLITGVYLYYGEKSAFTLDGYLTYKNVKYKNIRLIQKNLFSSNEEVLRIPQTFSFDNTVIMPAKNKKNLFTWDTTTSSFTDPEGMNSELQRIAYKTGVVIMVSTDNGIFGYVYKVTASGSKENIQDFQQEYFDSLGN